MLFAKQAVVMMKWDVSGNAELEKRRAELREQQRKEEEARLAKEKAEQEKREAARYTQPFQTGIFQMDQCKNFCKTATYYSRVALQEDGGLAPPPLYVTAKHMTDRWGGQG